MPFTEVEPVAQTLVDRELMLSDERKARKRKLDLKKKQKEKLEAAIEELDDYICSCPGEMQDAFLLVFKWARKGVKTK